MAFPAISAGAYGWPLDDAARIAVTAVWDQSFGAGEPGSVADVRMVAYSADAQRALIDARDRLAR